MNKEYGGCLWLDTNLRGREYYHAYKNHQVEVDSGRSALQYIIETYSYKRIWLPIYNCPLVNERIKMVSNITVRFYNLNEDFSPDVRYSEFEEGDIFLWVNYCGVMKPELINNIVMMQNIMPIDVIIDNIPAFFSKPRMEVFNIYSCRKFIGVSDGGYLIKKGIVKNGLPIYDTTQNYYYLLKAAEKGSNAAYRDYLEREKRITDEQIAYGMPKLTKKILCGINYEDIKERRKKNFQILHDLLGDKNRMKMYVQSDTPSVYPYLTSDKELRKKLLNNCIYVSRFWKHVLTNKSSNLFEKDLAEFLIPLPIDQRYNKKDMEKIAEIVIDIETK